MAVHLLLQHLRHPLGLGLLLELIDLDHPDLPLIRARWSVVPRSAHQQHDRPGELRARPNPGHRGSPEPLA
jgi:hypothetical protein